MQNSCHDVIVGLCVLYTIVSFLSWWMSRPQSQRIAAFLSPHIKPLDYRNEDLLLRKELTAVNWQLIGNKARALHYLRKTAAPPFAEQPNKIKATLGYATRKFIVLSKARASI